MVLQREQVAPVTLETRTTIRVTDGREPVAQGEALAAEKCKHLGESADFCTYRSETAAHAPGKWCYLTEQTEKCPSRFVRTQ